MLVVGRDGPLGRPNRNLEVARPAVAPNLGSLLRVSATVCAQIQSFDSRALALAESDARVP